LAPSSTATIAISFAAAAISCRAASTAFVCPLAAFWCRRRRGLRSRRRRRGHGSRRRCGLRSRRCRRRHRSRRSWCGLWSRRRRGLRSGAAGQNCDIGAADELLDILGHIAPTRFAVEIPMEVVGVPPCLLELTPIAPVVVLPEPAVSCPPAPLQSARLAAQVQRDDVPELVCLGQISERWQVEALWVPNINGLAVRPRIIRNAIGCGLWTHQQPGIGASIPSCGVADPHLNVTEVVRCDLVPELHHLSSRVGGSDGFFAVATATPFCSPSSVQAVVVPRASNRRTQVTVTVST